MDPNARVTRSSRHSAAPIAVGGLLACGLFVYLSVGGAPQEAPAPLPTPSVAVAATDPLPGPAFGTERTAVESAASSGWYGAPVGSWFCYEFESRDSYRMVAQSDEVRGNASQEQVLGCRGRLRVQIAARRDGEVIAAVSYAEFAIDAAATPDVASRLASLAQPTLVRVLEDGTVLGYRFGAGLDGEQRNFQRWLLSAFGFPVPPGAATRWESAGADATGQYLSRYVGVETPTGLRVERTKLRYTAMTPALGDVPAHRIEGGARATLSRAVGWLVTAAVDETLTLDLEVVKSQLVHHTQVRLALLDSGRVAVDTAVPDAEAPWAPPGGEGEDLRDAVLQAEEQAWRHRLHGVALHELVEELRALLAGRGADPSELYAAWTKLSWFLRLHPDAADRIREIVLGEPAPREICAMLLSALGNAGTAPAQDVLAGFFADALLEPSLRESAVVAMMQLQHPKAGLLSALAAGVQELAEVKAVDALAVLVLGALAARSDARVFGEATALEVVLALETSARRLGAADLWLHALGNAGMPQVLDRVAAYLDDPVDSVREAAVFAIRKLASPAAVEIMARKAIGDASPRVRATAAEALTQHFERGAREALYLAARADTEVDVRRAAIAAIAHDLERDHAGRALLQEIASSDRSREIRELVRELLAGRS